MREVVAPQHVVEPDLVTHSDLTTLGVRRPDEAVAVELLTRLHGDAERRELLRTLLTEEQAVPEPQQARHPPAARLGHSEPQSREALEDPGPQHEPHRPGRPPDDFRDI